MNAHGERSAVEAQPATRSRWPGWVPYVAPVIVIAALVASLSAIALSEEKKRYRERAALTTENIAGLLAQQLGGMFDNIDSVLQSVAYHFAGRAAPPQSDPDQFRADLEQQESLLPEEVNLRVVDRQGIVRYGSGLPADQVVNVADRAYFAAARDGREPGLVVSGPEISPINGEWTIIFARRINAADGAFAGVVYAAYETAQFEKIFSPLALGKSGAVTLRTAKMALVNRYPGTDVPVGSTRVSKELHEIIRSGEHAGSYIASTALDGVERSNAFRKLARYPFYVIVGLATVDYLGGWKTNVVLLCAVAALTILVTVLAAQLAYRNTQRLVANLEERTRLGAELDQHRHHLEMLVAERTQALAEANEKLEVLSYSDGLTGIPNRRSFDRGLSQEWNRAQRGATPLALIMIDVDHFKDFNDHYGHVAGDDCLREIAQTLAATRRRAGELVARYGGEEFAVLLPDTTLAQALEVAALIREAVANLALPHAGSEHGILTVSLGASSVQPALGHLAEELVQQADLALYRAKQAGRNCACAYGE